ncbi:hypothetical protein C8R44DRAFT_773869 [Mycena epipterygia]|nr:hypothetical protein C8R44DRAFT_773869 [Mycena epipterygia]
MSLYRPLSRILQAHRCSGRRFLSTDYPHPPEDSFEDVEAEPPSASQFKFFTTRLNWILRHGAVREGLQIRPDGFVRIPDLKRCRKFKELEHSEFDALLKADHFRRFKIVQDFDNRILADNLWVRSRLGHSIKSVDVTVQRITSPSVLPMAVCSVNLRGWDYIARNGIPPWNDGFIHLVPMTPAENYSHTTGASYDVCIFLDVKTMLQAGIQLFKTSRGEVLTNGDRDGFLRPNLFKEVVRIQVEREIILSPSL